MATTIKDVEKLGYTCTLASGSVDIEEQALDEARAGADPALIQEQVNTLVADTVTALTKLGKVPADESERLQMFAQMGETAFQTLTNASTEKVAFHERALTNAKTMPNTWYVSGPGVGVYVDCKDNGAGWSADHQAMLDALTDPAGHAERVKQAKPSK